MLLGRWTRRLGWARFRGWLLWTAGRCRLFRLIDVDTKHLTPVNNNSMIHKSKSFVCKYCESRAQYSFFETCPPKLYSLLVRHMHRLGCMTPTESFFSFSCFVVKSTSVPSPSWKWIHRVTHIGALFRNPLPASEMILSASRFLAPDSLL